MTGYSPPVPVPDLTEADRLAAVRKALFDPSKVTERLKLHDEWTGPPAMEPMHQWQARAVMEVIAPWLKPPAKQERPQGDYCRTHRNAHWNDGDRTCRWEPIAGWPSERQAADRAAGSRGYMRQASAPSLRGVDLSRERPGELPS